MKVKNKFLATALAVSILGVSGSYALPLLSIEAGVGLGADIKSISNFSFDDNTKMSYGAYGRVWFKPGYLRIAPFVKWQSIGPMSSLPLLGNGSKEPRTNNLQYGGLIGFELGGFFTIYGGGSYSHFINSGYSNTWAINYGLKIKIPVIPITLGLDASYQKPKFRGEQVSIHIIQATLGLQF